MSDRQLEALLDLERAVWDALVAGDAAADGALLAAHFVGVYPTGFATKADHTGQLDDGPTIAEYALAEPRVVELGADARLLCYRASYRRPAPGAPTEEMYVSSLWVRTGERWLNVFSQDTPAARG